MDDFLRVQNFSKEKAQNTVGFSYLIFSDSFLRRIKYFFAFTSTILSRSIAHFVSTRIPISISFFHLKQFPLNDCD